jgi:pilus assembly protein CpaF
VLHCARLQDGTRKVTSICEVVETDGETVEMQDLFVFDRDGVSPRGRVVGRFRATGLQPKFMNRLKAYGIHLSPEIFHETQEVRER